MIRIARLTDYGIVLLTHMAARPHRLHNAAELAGDVGLPAPTVSKLLRILAREGLLASLPGLSIETPGQPPFRLIGGHRLWAAPEVPASTYLPDDGPPGVERAADSVSFSERQASGLRKTLRVAPGPDSVVVDHVLANEGSAPTRVAPWAITMLTPGGEAWLPRFMGRTDAGGFQANGSLVLWPYTRFGDARLVPGDPVTRVLAVAGSEGRVKVGLPDGGF